MTLTGTKRSRETPAYPLNEVKRLAKSRKMTVNRRALNFIMNHMDVSSPMETVSKLIGSMEESDFLESVCLDTIPGTWADVYQPEFCGETWYVKLFIHQDGSASLSVMSANWDGYIH